MGAPGTSDKVRGRADVRVEEATKLASGVTDTISKGTFIEAVEESIGDQLDGGHNRLRRMAELDRTEMSIRSTPKTRPIAGSLRSDRRGVGRDVARIGPTRAPGPTIDAGGGDCRNGHESSMPDPFGQIRTYDISRATTSSQPDSSDLDVCSPAGYTCTGVKTD
jgi:hypothetical protein